jgi:GntR family transcriptional regulator
MFHQVTHDERVSTLDPDAPEPLYEQLAGILREKIRTGEIPSRRALPSNRTLTQEYGVARGTATHAVAILIDEGWAYTVHGRGVFSVAEADRPDRK